MTAGKQLNWCARCHHAIVPLGGTAGGWAHFSADDWDGRRGECPCANDLVRCQPERRRPWVTGTVTGRLRSIT